jgi:hypothetical protein
VRTCLTIVVALLAGAVCGRSARAQSPTGPDLLGQAQQEHEALRYEQAAPLLDRAWRAGGHRPAQLAVLFRLTGEVAVTLGQGAAADIAFQRLLALDPGAALPEGTSPKIAARLEAARTALGGRSLRVDIERRDRVVTANVVSDPLDMVASVRVRAGTAERSAALDPASAALRVPLPSSADPSPARIEVLDRHGNVLLEMERAAAARAAQPARPARIDLTTAPERDDPPLLARGLTWTAAAAGVGAVGVFFGLRSESAQDDLDALNRTSAQHDFRDALDVEDRLRRDALIANISFAVAGAAAVTAAVLWVREWRSPRLRPAPRRTRAAGLGWSVEF